MVCFSLLTDMPAGGRHLTLEGHRAALGGPTYRILLWKSLRFGAVVTALCALVGAPCAWVPDEFVRGRRCCC